jgi:hypothetical protein
MNSHLKSVLRRNYILQPVVVVLSSLNSVELVKASVGMDCFVGLAHDVKDILDWLSGKCLVGLVDGRPTRKNLRISGTRWAGMHYLNKESATHNRGLEA